MKLSIVTTLFCSDLYIETFILRASKAAKQVAGDDYEIVLVNDDSSDKSLNKALALYHKDSHITVVDLSRNFGHHKAIMTGLSYARGQDIFLIDSDLEEEPEWLIPFHEKKIKTKSDVVYGVQILRKGHLAERFVNGLYYPIISLLSSIQIPRDMVTARLMSRRYTLSLLRFRERDLDLGGLWCLTGYSQVPYPVTKHSHSPTTYTFRKKLSLFFNSVTSFSSAPLLSIFYLGMSVFIVSIGYSTWVAVRWLFTPQPIEGWTSLIISIWLTSGLLIMSVGVVGIYLAHVFNEVKRRPYTIVRELYRH